jgi:3-oxoadipate enol-lactonase
MSYTATRPRLFFTDGGTGVPFLCIPGFAASSAVYESLRPLYESHFRFVTYDHPGSGRSAKYGVPISMAQLAAHAARILDELDIEAAHVLGASLGGLVAQELAIRFPHRVRALVLVGTATSGPLATPPPIEGLARATAYTVADSVRRRQLWLGRAVFADDFAAGNEANPIIRSLASYLPPPWTLFGQVLAFATHERQRDLGRIRAPTLILHGERDRLVSIANTYRLAAGIPNAALHVVPGAGHGCLFEQSEPVLETICQWIDRHGPIDSAARPTGVAALTERITRKAAVPIGAWRVQRNLLALVYRALRRT